MTAELSTFATALEAADLDQKFAGAGTFTVFAPTNAAFEALGAGELDRLLKSENKAQLVHLLKYHVIENKKVTSDQMAASQTETMLNGMTLTVKKGDGDDLECTNGVVHIVDKVLTPGRQAEAFV